MQSTPMPEDEGGVTRRSNGALVTAPIVVCLWVGIMVAPFWLVGTNELPKLASTLFGVAAAASGATSITLWLALRELATIDRKLIGFPLGVANIVGGLIALIVRQVYLGINC